MSPIARQLQAFEFVELFNQLGWDRLSLGIEKEVGGEVYALQPVAQKRGIQILHCSPDSEGAIPPYAIRQKIERKVTADAREHLIIFTDAAQTRQIWQWVSRATGRPTQYREVKWQSGQPTELLEQKLKAISFNLDEEESLNVFGVAERLRGGFDRDNVTKEFYKVFEAQRNAFQKFIDGIPSDDHQRWYTAVVIDRLMFLWFLQEKFFLDGNKRYLRDRLEEHLKAAGVVSFYKAFLNPLFFRGFAEERTEANRAAIEHEFGKVPYLNGGLFAEHELEREYGEAIDIPDTAFSSLFAFFDEWDWHLDERPLASGKEINPDVLGYIFEKFVNQKQMGAYYTKEDITEYIAKNTIIPCLFEKVRADNKAAFDTHVWPLLQEDPHRYIYPAMLHGLPPSPASGEGESVGRAMPDNQKIRRVEPALQNARTESDSSEGLYPPEIANGLDTQAPNLLERRKLWNKTAAPSHGLPTEIWRETIARHNRTREILTKLQAGEINSVADLITYNLNIRQFAQDVIERCTDPALLRAFWVALAGRLPRKSNEKYRHGMSVLDPTCGSGAFLFAALQILKPLYQACLTAMSGALLDAAILPSPAGGRGAGGEGTLKDIEEIVERFHAAAVDRERDYAITKHIIVNNLYGVDIETQATEIAKLRLFLKLVALLEPGDDIEPLPDIDFNIRAGNTLVGYASAKETEQAVTQGKFDFDDTWGKIKTKLVAVEQAYNNFQIQQVQRGGHVSAEDKQALGEQLHELEETLNHHLCREYGKDPSKAKQYGDWKVSHKPFHWYVDYYPIMAAGGFDAVIGNPPYVQLSEIGDYSVKRYACADCGNLYAVMLERSAELVHSHGRTGFIIPVSSISTDGYSSLQAIYSKQYSHISCFDDRPSRLFDGLEHIRLVIALAARSQSPRWVTTRYYKWTSEERQNLFQRLAYFETVTSPIENAVPKMGSELELSIIDKVNSAGRPLAAHLSSGSSNVVNYSRKVGYFLQVIDFVPRVLSGDGTHRPPSEFKTLCFSSKAEGRAALALLNSSLFYWFMTLLSDCRHLNKREIEAFPVAMELLLPKHADYVNHCISQLMLDLESKSEERVMKFKHDTLTVQCLLPKKSWHLIQDVDAMIARATGLSPLEEDYISGYDIKYRMGLNGQEDDADD